MSATERGLLLPTVLTAVGLALLLGLGAWQFERRADKHALIATIEDLAAPPLETWTSPPPADAEFRHADLAGTFLHDHEFRLLARTREGRVGDEIVTPLRLDDGRILLVDRGWVPREGGAAEHPQGEVRVEGVLKRPPKPGWAATDNRPDSNQWLYIDPAAMARASGLVLEPDYYLVAAPRDPARLPLGTEVTPMLRDDHLQYALTWCGLAVVLATVYGVWLGRQDR